MTEPALHVVSYNIRKGMGTDRRRDPYRILSVLKDSQADIVILQEADLRLGQRPSALPRDRIADTGLSAVDVATSPVSLGWHGNAILVRPDWPVVSVDRITLPGLEPRGAVTAVVRTPLGWLRVIGAHLGLLRRSRQGQQHALVDWVADHDEMPTIIAGDLNEWSARRGLGPLSQVFDLHSPGHSFHARLRLAPLDRIGLSRDLSLERIDMLDTAMTRAASDHLPIRANVRLRHGTA